MRYTYNNNSENKYNEQMIILLHWKQLIRFKLKVISQLLYSSSHTALAPLHGNRGIDNHCNPGIFGTLNILSEIWSLVLAY